MESNRKLVDQIKLNHELCPKTVLKSTFNQIILKNRIHLNPCSQTLLYFDARMRGAVRRKLTWRRLRSSMRRWSSASKSRGETWVWSFRKHLMDDQVHSAGIKHTEPLLYSLNISLLFRKTLQAAQRQWLVSLFSLFPSVEFVVLTEALWDGFLWIAQIICKNNWLARYSIFTIQSVQVSKYMHNFMVSWIKNKTNNKSINS